MAAPAGSTSRTAGRALERRPPCLNIGHRRATPGRGARKSRPAGGPLRRDPNGLIDRSSPEPTPAPQRGPPSARGARSSLNTGAPSTAPRDGEGREATGPPRGLSDASRNASAGAACGWGSGSRGSSPLRPEHRRRHAPRGGDPSRKAGSALAGTWDNWSRGPPQACRGTAAPNALCRRNGIRSAPARPRKPPWSAREPATCAGSAREHGSRKSALAHPLPYRRTAKSGGAGEPKSSRPSYRGGARRRPTFTMT